MLVEHCKTVKNRRGNLIPLEELEGKKGFRGVYGFDEGASIIIQQQGHSRGLSRFNLYSDCLFIDFDDQPEEAKKLKEILLSYNFTFKVYDSGNRSFHFHIPHPLKEGKGLPYTHMCVLEKLGLDMTKVDTTLYRPNSIFRLEGTLHSKTGDPKVEIFSYEGVELDFDVKEAPKVEKDTYASIEERDDVILGKFLSCATKLLWDGVESGSRYNSLFYLGSCACEANVSFETCYNMALTLNESFDDPHDENEVERAVKNGFKFINNKLGDAL